jgi:hypothetical protein
MSNELNISGKNGYDIESPAYIGLFDNVADNPLSLMLDMILICQAESPQVEPPEYKPSLFGSSICEESRDNVSIAIMINATQARMICFFDLRNSIFLFP